MEKRNDNTSEEAYKVATNDPSSISPLIIDMDIFGQLLEMDDEDDREFSREIVWNYFDQAESTFEKMDKALCVHPSSSRAAPLTCFFSQSRQRSLGTVHSRSFP